jgi:protein-S-isoprenylcysteine O-methyltransferase Ste14
MTDAPSYGLWTLVALNTAVFVFFAFSFAKPRTGRDWRSLGAFSAFLLALFTEMYGFPLTIYLLAGWLQSRYPGLDLLSHNSGHLWETLLGATGDPHLSPLHLVSNLLIGGGFVLLGSAWKVLHAAQVDGRLAATGPYARVRHPQYGAFVLILLGFLLQWPTVLTLVMFPVLVAMYLRLARREEREALARFGNDYASYAAATPAFLPRLTARAWAAGGNRDEDSARTHRQPFPPPS